MLTCITSLLQCAQRLTDLAEMIRSMHHNGQGSADGVFVPHWVFAEEFVHALVCFAQFALVLAPFLRRDLFYGAPDVTPVARAVVTLQGKAFERLDEEDHVCNLGGERGAFASNGDGGFLSRNSFQRLEKRCPFIQKDAVMKFIARLGGEKKYKFVYMKLERIYKKLGIRLKSQLFLCVFMGVAMYAALWILAIFGIDLPQK